MDIAQEVGVYVGAASFVGLAIFVPLFLSQSRDIRRLRVWSEREPEAAEHAVEAAIATARVAQQAAVARATGTAETTRAEVRAAAREAAAMSQTPADRIAADRPATTRITAERAALAQPTWRRWLSGGPNTRQLMWIVGGVFVLGLAVALVSLQIAGGGDDAAEAPAPTVEEAGIVKADVDVAVLNGTAVPGLAAKVGDDVDTSGYALGAVTNSDVPADESMVLFERGHEDEAEAVADDLGIKSVGLIDEDSRALADGADVVVIAGEDRAEL